MQQHKKGLAIVIAFFVAAALVGVVGYLSTPFLGDDNPIEEMCEKIIQEELGFEVDLTPKSPEDSHAFSP